MRRNSADHQYKTKLILLAIVIKRRGSTKKQEQSQTNFYPTTHNDSRDYHLEKIVKKSEEDGHNDRYSYNN